MKKIVATIFFLSISCPVILWADFDFDELEEVEKIEQTYLLELAKQEAKKLNFSEAESLLEEARQKLYNPLDVKEVKKIIIKTRRVEEERKRKAEAKRLAQIEQEAKRRRQQQVRSGSTSIYITSWGYNFSGDDRIWGRNGVKLNTGTEFYTWLNRETYGMKCYEVHVQGGLSGGGSNCNNSLNGNWSVFCRNSGQFWVQGDHTDVVKAIVKRCGQ